jgi:ABC-type nickel/cobalt efflux system permease component RcnA
MFGLDETIAGLGGDGGLLVALAVALLLGLRHATDPDHLTAVSTLVVSEDDHGTRRAARLGTAWGLGHACTLVLFGLPVVLFGDHLSESLQSAFEVAIGLVIVALAVRLLVRWRRGYLHVHVHEHDGERHAHPHVHEGDRGGAHPHAHSHSHAEEGLGRSALASFGIGLVHGAGGSAGVGVLLIAAMPGEAERVAALVVLAVGTAISMALVSAGFGYALARGPLVRRFEQAAPVFGVVSLAFGVWYALGATGAVPYAF